MLKRFFCRPTTAELALRELRDAQHGYLEALSAMEYAKAMAEYHAGRILRLTIYVAPPPIPTGGTRAVSPGAPAAPDRPDMAQGHVGPLVGRHTRGDNAAAAAADMYWVRTTPMKATNQND